MDVIAMILMIIGALNWGAIGLAQFDIVAALFGGMSALFRALFTRLSVWQAYGESICW